jgi:hypothetical protein
MRARASEKPPVEITFSKARVIPFLSSLCILYTAATALIGSEYLARLGLGVLEP